MLGQWPLGKVTHDMLIMALENLRESGFDHAVLIAEGNGMDSLYWLVCTDPDGEWFWLSDPHDTGWHMPDRRAMSDLYIAGKALSLVVAE